jgi:iron complex outermembrane receptor protein
MRPFLWIVSAALWAPVPGAADQQPPQTGTIVVQVMHEGTPLPGAEVRVGDRVGTTGPGGELSFELPSGVVKLEVSREGLENETAEVVVKPGTDTRVIVELHEHTRLEEEVIVTATRTGKRLQDQAVRVEVLEREEIEEKLLMTPGDIAMLLNETSGLRVQVASPSLGAANVRIQGLRGRYTQILADGLPLYGGQTGSIGLLQIPPMDLGQVEIIKGVASAFYGASALGGVINLVSRRPPREKAERELLLNRSTSGGTDGLLWLAGTPAARWGLTFLGGLHHQPRRDVDGDFWADIAGYKRGMGRPRLFWDDGTGRSVFVTAGFMAEDRRGGTLAGGTVGDGRPFEERLDTRRYDGGVVGRVPLGPNRLISFRASAMSQRHEHGFGPVTERDRHRTWLAEAAVTGTHRRHAWVVGAATQIDSYRARDVAGFDYARAVPGIFVQDDVALGPKATLSASARLDQHDEFGTFFNPRFSALLRPGQWTIRASAGSGYYAPTAFTEETEAVGLTRVLPPRDLQPERARSASLDAGIGLGVVELHGTIFGSTVTDPVAVRITRDGHIAITNASAPTRTVGSELLARIRWRQFVATGTYTFTKSTEVGVDDGLRNDVPLTPGHAAGFVAAWEQHGKSRIGFELYYTGSQRLDQNPYRTRSRPYVVVGFLGERRIRSLRFFVNAENLTNVRQTRYDPLIRPTRAPDSRWTVDAWAPLEGRVFNGGVRLSF